MKKQNGTSNDLFIIHQNSEALLKKKMSKSDFQFSENKSTNAIQELEEQHIEFYIQNNKLTMAKELVEFETQKFAKIDNFTPLGYFTLSKEGEIIDANQSGLQMFGKEYLQIKNSSFVFFVTDQSKPTFNLFLKNIFKNKIKEYCQIFLTTDDHSTMKVQLNGIVTENDQQCLITMIDIAESKQVEAKSSLANAQLHSFIDSDIVGVIIVTIDGKIIEANDYYLNVVGYTREEFESGKVNWRKITPPEWIFSDENAILELHEKGKSTPFEKEYIHKNGNRVAVLITDAMLPGTDEHILSFVLDITERKRAEEGLKESEIKYRELVENSPDAIVIFVEGKIVFVNKESIRLVAAQNAEELIGKPVIQFVHPDYRSFVIKRMEKSASQGSVLNLIEEKFIRLDGSEVDVEIKAMPIRFEKKPAMQLIIRDITERKRAEDSLRKSEEKYRQLYESIMDAIVSIDMNGNIISANSEFQNLLGYTMDELLTMNYRDLSPEKWQNIEIEMYSNQVLERGYSYPYEKKYCKKNGSIIPVEIRIFLLKDDHDQPSYMWAIVRDITERKQVEKTLRNAYWRLESIIEGTQVGTWEWNVQTGETVFNEMWAQIIGYTLDELTPYNINTWESFLHPDDLKQSYELLDQHFTGEIPYYNIDFRMKHKNGHWVWIHDRGRVITATSDGKPLMMLGTHIDITERKRAEEELKHLNEALEERVIKRTAELLKSNEKFQQAEEKFRTVADFTYDWEYWINDKGNYNYISPSCERITGYTAEEFTGDLKLIDKIIYKPDFELWKNHNNNEHLRLTSEIIPELNFRIVTKKGHIRWIDHICRRIYNEGNYLGIRASNRDITEKIKAENELLRVTVEVEERERNQFSRELHDGLGPLLSTIKLYFQWLSETNDVEKIKIITEKGNNNIESAIQTIRDMAQGLSTLFLKKSGYVDAVLNFTQSINDLQRLHINFTYNSRERFSDFLETTLYRITTELIKNTITYAIANRVEIGFNYTKEKNTIAFTYTDNGIGFDLAAIKKTGTGLGLMNIQQRVKIIKGYIRIETKVGKGMKVTIKLPVNDTTNILETYEQ